MSIIDEPWVCQAVRDKQDEERVMSEKPENWIQHDGKGMPVDRMTLVKTIHRGGDEYTAGDDEARIWEYLPNRWVWSDHDLDIVSYCVCGHSPTPPKP